MTNEAQPTLVDFGQVKPTPGPWESLETSLGWDVVSEKWSVAALYEMNDKANARLIAAAPDMLAALKSLVSDISEYEWINNLSPTPGKKDCWQSVTVARALIAKAEGRTP